MSHYRNRARMLTGKQRKFSSEILKLDLVHVPEASLIYEKYIREHHKFEPRNMSFHELVELQRQNFLSGATKNTEHRKELLLTLKKILEDEQVILTEAVYKDLKRRPEVTVALELTSALVEVDYTLDNLEEWMSPSYVEKTFLSLLDIPMIVKEPLGVVLIIAPWNYPLNLIMLTLIPAIAAGNTVVIKPSEISVNTAGAIAETFGRYFDQKFVAVVTGGVAETTELLKERFDHIFFTGSSSVAKTIMTAAAKHLTPVTLELGGKCPVVVESDADIEISAKRIAWGKWLNCGQTCLAPDYILVEDSVKPRLIASILKALTEFYGEVRSSEDYSRIINENHFNRLMNLVENTNAKMVIESEKPDKDDLFIPPLVLEANRSDIVMKDEIFGPILPIVSVGGLDDAVSLIRSGEKPLAAYIFTKDEEKVRYFCEMVPCGGICVNDVIIQFGVDTLPFGGVGCSGMGRYRGKFGFDTFTHEKSVLKRGFFSEMLTASRYPPGSPEKFSRLKALTGTRRGIPQWYKKYFPVFPLLLFNLILGFFLQRFGLK